MNTGVDRQSKVIDWLDLQLASSTWLLIEVELGFDAKLKEKETER